MAAPGGRKHFSPLKRSQAPGRWEGAVHPSPRPRVGSAFLLRTCPTPAPQHPPALIPSPPLGRYQEISQPRPKSWFLWCQYQGFRQPCWDLWRTRCLWEVIPSLPGVAQRACMCTHTHTHTGFSKDGHTERRIPSELCDPSFFSSVTNTRAEKWSSQSSLLALSRLPQHTWLSIQQPNLGQDHPAWLCSSPDHQSAQWCWGQADHAQHPEQWGSRGWGSTSIPFVFPMS